MTAEPDAKLPRPNTQSVRRRPTQSLRPEPEHNIVHKPEPSPDGPVLAPWEEANEAKISARRATVRVDKTAAEKSTQSFGKMPTREVKKPATKPTTKPVTKPIPQSPPRPIEQLEPQIKTAAEDLKNGMSPYDVRQKLLYGGVAETQVLEVIAIARERSGVPATGATRFLSAPGIEKPVVQTGRKTGPVHFIDAPGMEAKAPPEGAVATPTVAPSPAPAEAASLGWPLVGGGVVVALIGIVLMVFGFVDAEPGAKVYAGAAIIFVGLASGIYGFTQVRSK